MLEKVLGIVKTQGVSTPETQALRFYLFTITAFATFLTPS